jgi:hypothetical protein
MVQTPVVPLLLLNLIIVPAGQKTWLWPNQSTAELSSMQAKGGLRGNDKVLKA